MGIKPKGTEYVVVPPDNPTSRWGEWEASLDGAGDTAGEVFAETHAIAKSAKSEAQLAVEDSGRFLTAAANMREEALEGVDPASPEYALWAAWDAAEQAQDNASRALGEAVLANNTAIQALARTVANMFVIRYGQSYTDEHFVASWDGNVMTIAKRYNWVGDVTNVEFGEWAPTQQSEQYTWSGDHTFLYQVKQGYPRALDITSAARTLGDNVWTTLASWTVPENTDASAFASFVWSAKTYTGVYSARLTLDGVPAATGEVSRGAPLFGHAARPHEFSMRLRKVNQGQVLRLQAAANFGNPLNRGVRNIHMNVQWIDHGGSASETVALTGTAGDESVTQFRQALIDRGYHHSTITELPFDLDISAANDLSSLFQDCAALETLPDMDTAHVLDAEWMFYGCTSLTDGNVKLIGKNPAVFTTDMIGNSGLTREPFFDAAGNPI